MKIKTKFQEEGINKRTVSLEDQKRLIFEGKEIEAINYVEMELEKNDINKRTNALKIQTLCFLEKQSSFVRLNHMPEDLNKFLIHYFQNIMGN